MLRAAKKYYVVGYPCIKFRLLQCFSLSVTCTIHVLLEVVCCCFPRNNILLNMPMFVGSQSFISLSSFMFVSAVVSEIRESKEKKEKKNSEIDYFQFNTFPGHIIYPFFNQRYHLSTCTDSIC